MHVAVERHRGTNLGLVLHRPNRHSHIVDHAEAFAVVGKRVVKSAANADAHAVGEALPRRQDRSPGRQPERFRQVARVRNLHLHFFARAERAGLQLLHVLGSVHQPDFLIGRGLGFKEVFGLGDSLRDQPVAHPPVFFGGEDVVPDGKIVGVAVDQLERKHWMTLDNTSNQCHPERSRGPRSGRQRSRRIPATALARGARRFPRIASEYWRECRAAWI